MMGNGLTTTRCIAAIIPGLFALGTVAAQEPADTAAPPPAVHVLATGGTISNATGGRRTGEELVEGLPALERVARVTVEQFSNVASSAITLEQWRDLSRRVNQLLSEQPDLAGIVITHGTDTMEETAYFLELTVPDCRPVVVTGAMRNASAIAPDGPANLYNAIRVAAAPAARRIGAVVLMNDRIYGAREVTKVNTLRTDAFDAPEVGPIGVADRDRIAFSREPLSPRCGRPAFDPGTAELPRVDIVYTYQGADGSLIRAAAAAGARGIVIATAGAGAMTPGQNAAVREVAEQGVIVVRSSRTGSGRVTAGGSNPNATSFGAGNLTPQKARILLMLALAATDDRAAIRGFFDMY